MTNYLIVLRSGTTMRFIAIQTLAFSVMLVFITHAAFIYQEWFGASNRLFSLLFALQVAGMVAANFLNRRLLRSFHSTQILRVACAVQSVAVVLLLAAFLRETGLTMVALCMILTGACLGTIIPNSIANALEFFPRLGGTASALLGATQFSVGGFISALSTWLTDGTPLPIVIVMLASTLSALVFAIGAPGAMRRALGIDAPSRETIGRR